MYEFTPEKIAASVYQRVGTFGTFQMELPYPDSANNFNCRPILWIDKDDDNLLDLTDDSASSAQIALSEFNRFPIYDPKGDYVAGIDCNSNDRGYKFNCGNETFDLDHIDKTDFSFNMTPETSGW